MDLQAFLMENLPALETREVTVSERFPVPFRVRGISEEENSRIRRKYQAMGEVDTERYLLGLAAACVVEPDLEDAALQHSWGVLGAEALLQKMLAAGEFARLLAAAQAVCGFDVPVRELADELKNGSCRATQNSTTPITPCMN